MPISISDVARRAGVSGATVSKVLNNADGARISSQTRSHVMRVANDLGYMPNARARSLRTQRTNIIGFYSGYGDINANNPYLAELIKGIMDQCAAQRVGLLLHGGKGLATVESIYAEMVSGQIDAVVLNTPPDDPLVERLAASSLPAVVVVDAVPGVPSVVVDDAGGARLIADHLAAKGHRRIMYCLPGDVRGTSVRRRLAAFLGIASEIGLMVHEIIEADNGWALSRVQKELLALPAPERPTAAVCWHDSSAYGLVTAARAYGLRVPEDLAVVGFNGVRTDASRMCDLTTVRAPWAEIGRTAASLVGELIKGGEAPDEISLGVDLVAGETT